MFQNYSKLNLNVLFPTIMLRDSSDYFRMLAIFHWLQLFLSSGMNDGINFMGITLGPYVIDAMPIGAAGYPVVNQISSINQSTVLFFLHMYLANIT